jgi:hypothetical protein
MNKKCKNCIYFDSRLPDTIGESFCRRYPPAMIDIMCTGQKDLIIHGYPDVEPDDWCGEFKREREIIEL